jgi:hypothetical protein
MAKRNTRRKNTPVKLMNSPPPGPWPERGEEVKGTMPKRIIPRNRCGERLSDHVIHGGFGPGGEYYVVQRNGQYVDIWIEQEKTEQIKPEDLRLIADHLEITKRGETN